MDLGINPLKTRRDGNPRSAFGWRPEDGPIFIHHANPAVFLQRLFHLWVSHAARRAAVVGRNDQCNVRSRIASRWRASLLPNALRDNCRLRPFRLGVGFQQRREQDGHPDDDQQLQKVFSG